MKPLHPPTSKTHGTIKKLSHITKLWTQYCRRPTSTIVITAKYLQKSTNVTRHWDNTYRCNTCSASISDEDNIHLCIKTFTTTANMANCHCIHYTKGGIFYRNQQNIDNPKSEKCETCILKETPVQFWPISAQLAYSKPVPQWRNIQNQEYLRKF